MTHLLLGVCINLILIVVLAMNIYFMNNNIEKMSDNIVWRKLMRNLFLTIFLTLKGVL